MGTCCSAHLATKVRDYASNAQNGAVTVTVIENPHVNVKIVPIAATDATVTYYTDKTATVKEGKCDYCDAPAEFTCSYYPKHSNPKVRTTVDFIEDVIRGKEKYKCVGFPIPYTHDVVEYQLTIGKSMYSYACPKCGYGEGGSLSEEVCKKLQALQKEVLEKKR
jgi:hypothetical protein